MPISPTNQTKSTAISPTNQAKSSAVSPTNQDKTMITTYPNSTTIDSYSESNKSTDAGINSAGWLAVGQSFTATGLNLTSCKFSIFKVGSPTGNAYAKVYIHTGTYGTSSKPIGSVLATSDAFDVSDLTGSSQLKTFTFSGTEQILLTNEVYYCVELHYDGGDGNNQIGIATDATTPTHSGNQSYKFGSLWYSLSERDTCFYIYGSVPVQSAPILTNQTKSSAISPTNQTKNTASNIKNQTKN